MVNWKTLNEIAKHLRIPSSTVYKLKERGEIRGYRVGRALRFDPEEVDDDIKSKKPIRGATRILSRSQKSGRRAS
jgi:excisionase family DNA binding protein